MKEQEKLIRIHDLDNAAVALSDLSKGSVCTLNGEEITLLEDIPFGHKAALCDIKTGENVLKYGSPIGSARADIARGQHIHIHNLKTSLSGIEEYTYLPDSAKPFSQEEAYFDGYVRSDGRVGVRNEIWILPTVGCVNTTAKLLEQEANRLFMGKEGLSDKLDGVYAFTHNMGCSQLSDDHITTQKILKGLANNPNAAGVLILSLGCENNHLEAFKPVLGDYDPRRVKFLVTQDAEDEYEAGMRLLEELAEYAAGFRRERVSADKLVLGFKCGGSDAFSGILANPLCGRVNDRLVACGGSTLLTEVPEMFGAEKLLMARADSEETFFQIVKLINSFKKYFLKYGQTIYENPSPGNKKGGISTLEEKSLGCTQKGGQAPVMGVLSYGEPLTKRGLNLLTGPGNDQVSCTNLTAAGAQLLCFTTGRGNPFGAPVPTVKISSNSRLCARKGHWIDFDAGQILEGKSLDGVAKELFDYILDVASGRIKTKNEINGYREISIFRDGVIL